MGQIHIRGPHTKTVPNQDQQKLNNRTVQSPHLSMDIWSKVVPQIRPNTVPKIRKWSKSDFENHEKQEETRMLEMTIGTLERENVARQNQTDSFDMRNLERNLFEKTWSSFILDG